MNARPQPGQSLGKNRQRPIFVCSIRCKVSRRRRRFSIDFHEESKALSLSLSASYYFIWSSFYNNKVILCALSPFCGPAIHPPTTGWLVLLIFEPKINNDRTVDNIIPIPNSLNGSRQQQQQRSGEPRTTKAKLTIYLGCCLDGQPARASTLL